MSYASGYSLPKTADTTKGVTAYGWGNHANAGYLTSINSSDVINALGYTPAREVSVGRMGLFAPKVRIVRGYTEGSPTMAIDPYLHVEHPLLDAGINAEAVLMVYSRRRGRIGDESTKVRPTYVSGWGEVRGNLATTAPLTWSRDIDLDDIRTFVLHNCMCGAELTESTMRSMTLSTFNSKKSPGWRFGFKGKHSQVTAQFKAKKSRLFGIAIRYENPEWSLYVSGNAAETTREIEGANHAKIKRYLYTDIFPIRIHVNPAKSSYWRIGFQLQPIGGPQKL